jgi:hypothetical protein
MLNSVRVPTQLHTRAGIRASLLLGIGTAALTLVACDRATPVAAVAGENANGAVPNITVQMANGVDLAKVQNPELVHAQFFLKVPDVDTPVIFGVVKADGRVRDPVILKKMGPPPGAWRVVQVSADWNEWVYAAACPARGEIWGILDAADAPKAEDLTLLRSVDGGATWKFFAAVAKPSPAAICTGFSMSANGRGRLAMQLVEDAGSRPHGYYYYNTQDGGKNWTGPTVETNDATVASTFAADQPLSQALLAAEAVPALGAGSGK